MQNHLSDDDRRRLGEANAELHRLQQQVSQKQQRQDRTRSLRQMAEQMRREGHRLATGYQGLHWQLEDADRLLMRGLLWAVGAEAVWLPEYDEVAEWLADNEGRGLMLVGDCGRGKSVITTKIVPMLFETGKIRCEDGYKMARPEVFTAQDLRTRMAEIMSHRVIIIDDVGTEPVARVFGETHNYFDELVNNAERLKKTLIISTNLTVDQLFGGLDEDPRSPTYRQVLTGRYDERTRSRLKAMTRQVYLEGDDLRDPQVVSRLNRGL